MSTTAVPATTAATARLAETQIQKVIEAAREVLRLASNSAYHDRRLAYDAMSKEDRDQMKSRLGDVADTYEAALGEAESSALSHVQASLQELVDKHGFGCVKHALESGDICGEGDFEAKMDLQELVDDCNRN
jgi:hypothetical protein